MKSVSLLSGWDLKPDLAGFGIQEEEVTFILPQRAIDRGLI